MEALSELPSTTANSLSLNDFVQITGHDGGMHKTYEWTNNTMIFGLYYDRGYFDCNLTSCKEPIKSFSLIILLKYLNNDILFYDKELAEVNLWNTLTTNEYFELFFRYYDLIKEFFINYNTERISGLKQFFDNQNET